MAKKRTLAKIFVLFSILKLINSMEIVWKTSLGTLIGSVRTSLSGYEYYAFEGVPFAKPPLGELRFKAPVLAGPWNGVLNATHEAPNCYEATVTFNTSESEDCLYLNIYTRNLNKNPTKNILFSIYGGGFNTGSNNHLGPEYLTDEDDLIYISSNYRLNIIGFLQLKDSTLGVPGNAGAKDIITALQWVQKYITNFGGDPNKVTIIGCSSAGQMVNLLMLHPLASKLFRHAISQSGSAVIQLSMTVFTKRKELAPFLNYYDDVENDRKFLDHLNTLSGKDLKEALIKYAMSVRRECVDWISFNIVIESPTNNPTPFILEKPNRLIQRGAFVNIPYLTSFTFQEGGVQQEFILECDEHYSDLLWTAPKCIKQQLNAREIQVVNTSIRKLYYGNKTITPENNLHALEIAGDCTFLYPNLLTWHTMAALTNFTMPIYTYYFNYSSPLNVLIAEVESITTAFKKYYNLTCIHCDELGYLYNDKNVLSAKYRPEDHETLTKVKSYKRVIMNFIRSGVPTSQEETDPTSKLVWRPWRSRNIFDLEYLMIEYPQIKMGNLKQSIFVERFKLWKEIFEKSKERCILDFAYYD